MKKEFFPIIIEDLSDSEHKGYAITFPEMHGSIVMGDNYEEIAKGVEMTFKDEQMKCPVSLLQGIKDYIEKLERNKNGRTLVRSQ
jgi:hypothetical protein